MILRAIYRPIEELCSEQVRVHKTQNADFITTTLQRLFYLR
jgi:hypothetical protein